MVRTIVARFRNSGIASGSASYLLSTGVAILAGLICVPLTLHRMPLAEFGVLTIYWALVTFLTNFDFGLSQTLVKILAARHEKTLNNEESKYISASIHAQYVIGITIAIAITVGTVVFASKAQRGIVEDNLFAYVMFLLTVPILSASISYKAALEAKLDFVFVSLTTMVNGMTQFIIPLVVVLLHGGLAMIIFVMLIQRILMYALLHWRLQNLFLFDIRTMGWDSVYVRKLFSTGGWVMATNISAALLHYADRFFITLFYPMRLVPFYTVPFEFLLRASIFPSVINRVSYSYLHRKGESGLQQRLTIYRKTDYIMSLFGVCVLLTVPILPWLITLWLGKEMGSQSGAIAQVIAVGLSFAGRAFLLVNVLIAAGRSDLEPKLQSIILVTILVAMYLVAPYQRLDYVAALFAARMMIYTTVMFIFVRRVLPIRGWGTIVICLGHDLCAAAIIWAVLGRTV